MAATAPAGPKTFPLHFHDEPVDDGDLQLVSLVASNQLSGPPNILQGGLAATLGLAAARRLAGSNGERVALHARLRAPTPVDRPVTVAVDRSEEPGTFRTEVREGNEVLVETTVRLDADGEPTLDGLEDLLDGSLPPTQPERVFTNCWVCGSEPTLPHALRLIPGWVSQRRVVIPWTPHPSFARHGDVVDPLVVAAALDCPTMWAAEPQITERGDTTGLLADYRVQVFEDVPVGAALRVLALSQEAEGRKLATRGALVDGDGVVYATCSALHISVPQMPTPP